MVYNDPKILILSGVLGSAFAGSCMPLTGIILARLLAYMTAPWETLLYMGQ